MKVLLCGHRSFAAQGLPEALAAAGHDLTTFGRGTAGRLGNDVRGPIASLSDNPHLAGPFDAIINYILLKDEPIEPIESNVRFMDELLKLCARTGAKHLVHISSISSYAASVSRITEDAALETVPERKGAYGSLKAATDLHLTAHAPADLKVSFVRPGFVLGRGLVHPIVGNAFRLPWNKLLCVGTAKRIFPVISREMVTSAVMKIVSNPPVQAREALLLVARNSPDIRTYLDQCCRGLGCGLGVQTYPAWLWWILAVGAEATARLVGQRKLQPYQKLASRLQKLTFEMSRTEERLGMKLEFDWRGELSRSMDGQDRNVSPPYSRFELSRARLEDVTFIGFGRIVRQKHLPALKKLNFDGTIRAYDLRAATDPSGQKIEAIGSAAIADSDLFIVATPGPAHVNAIDNLKKAEGPLLVEKPLCYDSEQLRSWIGFAEGRKSPVFVCHNYRFKENVARMMETLLSHNPGRLRNVHVHFQSPPVSNDSAAWLRNERMARTLLMDYSLHFLDLACMFAPAGEAWKIDTLRHDLNSAGQTELIAGRISCPAYDVSLLLRQGFAPRRARILFNFQNYSCSVGFFPDTFVVHMADEGSGIFKLEARQSAKATRRKIFDKLLGRDSDESHAAVIHAVTSGEPALYQSITIAHLRPFYELMFELGGRVYET